MKLLGFGLAKNKENIGLSTLYVCSAHFLKFSDESFNSELLRLKVMFNVLLENTRLDSNIESKSSNNTYLNVIKIFNKLFKKFNIIHLRNLIITST